MQFVADPPIAVKIQKMKERIRWRDPEISRRKIDQTRFFLDDPRGDSPEFSFLVIGDTGTGQQKYNPQRQVALRMLPHLADCRFTLHTGDVVYLVGSSEYYPENFIKPYKEMLVGGDRPETIDLDRILFKTPMFPVLGNHDYYDLPLLEGVFSGLTLPFRRFLSLRWDLDVGWHGSHQGQAFARAFLDYLARFERGPRFGEHLDRHYDAPTDTGYCLRYRPGVFTRLPNRYYTFRHGGIDFFALDSNTFNAPSPIPKTGEGEVLRHQLEQQLQDLEAEEGAIARELDRAIRSTEEEEIIHDLRVKLEQIEEMTLDIRKQLETTGEPAIDLEQLDWLERNLVESWNRSEVRGRVLFFHHPPYVTEATKWNLAQTRAIRQNIREVLRRVLNILGKRPDNRPLVDLVLNGHAHCLEYLRTIDPARADAGIPWFVCGGSGYSLRRQRPEGGDLYEDGKLMARSGLFVGRSGQGSRKRRPYSFLRVDTLPGTPPRFLVRPNVVERVGKEWNCRELPAIPI
ncbi:metallophosphoesterase [Pannus brasiliensis CCIBt3594]|uniref:Metallophosphoesterase n=1 Tax=Pannus brasiliensis CCIBt3594 TaxID=1427578 RepID=A0AAW9QJ53_9CHRO